MTSAHDRLTIEPAALLSAEAQGLIALLNAELLDRYPKPGDTHFSLSEEEVGEGRGTFLLARLDGEPVGCGALRALDAETGELKRMYVAPAVRRAGVGRRLLAELEERARGLGLRRLVLETGELQHEAMGLYERAGYARIPCFGEYLDSPASVCLGKPL